MSLDDLLEPEVVIAVGITAALLSPPVRRVLRKGAVYGLAGMMIVGDKVAGMARGAAHGVQNLARSARQTAEESTTPAGQRSQAAAEPVAG
jgi:hypothetical protein